MIMLAVPPDLPLPRDNLKTRQEANRLTGNGNYDCWGRATLPARSRHGRSLVGGARDLASHRGPSMRRVCQPASSRSTPVERDRVQITRRTDIRTNMDGAAGGLLVEDALPLSPP